MRILLIATIATLGLTTTAIAQEADVDCYYNIGLSRTKSGSSDSDFVSGRIGLKINPNFAVEAEGGLGFSEEKIGNIKSKAKGNMGIYAVGLMPVSEKFSVLGRVGYQHLWVEASIGPITAKEDEGSFAAGVGAQFMFDDKNGVRADYTRYTKNDGADNFALTYVRKF